MNIECLTECSKVQWGLDLVYKKGSNIMQYHGKDTATGISRKVVILEVKVRLTQNPGYQTFSNTILFGFFFF